MAREQSAVAGVPQRSAGEPQRSGGEPERSGGTPATAAPRPPPEEERLSPDPEVIPKAQRRVFNAAYKARILREADACMQPGQIGSLLRREGLYSSHLTEWRRLRDDGFLAMAASTKRGRKAKPIDPLLKKVAELEREIRRLQERLRKAELIIDVQKKVHDLLRLQEEGTKP